MSRLIDADALEKDGWKMSRTVRISKDTMEWLTRKPTDFPAIEPEQRWIPVTERLPENGHYYLWCSDMGSVQSDYYWNGFENGQKYGYTIVAWMPLPEPYKEGQE